MNIEGLGDAIMEDLYNYGYIKDISDIYLLKNYEKELEQLEGYGKKSVDKLFQNIENSKKNSLEKLLFGLGIKQVGNKTAKILSQRFSHLDNLMKATIDDLTVIPDIGPIIAWNVVDYFQQEVNQQLIEKLKQYGVNMEYLSSDVILDDDFLNKTFVLTGTLGQVTRDEASRLIEERGGKTTSSVTKKTSVVVVGDNPGSKYNKAVDLNIEIWNEKEFLEKINKTN